MTGSPKKRLDSWKAISAFLGKDVSTARRWEKESGLPVHRVPGNKRHAVYAFADELDAWLRGHHEPPAEPAPATLPPRALPGNRPRTALVIPAAVLITLGAAGLAVSGAFKRVPLLTSFRGAAAKSGQDAAREAYWRGRYYCNTRTADGLRTAIEYFKQAIEKNPRYSSAYAGLADSYTLLGLAGGGISAADVAPHARSAAATAVEMDSRSAEAHNSLAAVTAFYDWDWPGAEREFKRALELDQNYPPAHHWYGIVYLAAFGREAEAITEMKRALELDPDSAIYGTDLGWAFYLARRYDDAITQCRRVLARHPNFGIARFRLTEVYLFTGKYDEATETQDAVSAPTSMAKDYVPGTASEYRRSVRAQIDGYLKVSETARVSPFYFAQQYLRLGEFEEAMGWLEKAYAEREPALIYIWTDPLFDGLRGDARFRDLARKVGVGPKS